MVGTRKRMQDVWNFKTNMSVIANRMVNNPHKGLMLKVHLFLEEPKSSSAAKVSQGAVPGGSPHGEDIIYAQLVFEQAVMKS